MTTNIVVVGAPLTDNLGGPSMLASTVKVLSKYLQDPLYTFVSSPPNNKAEEELAQKYGLHFVPVNYFGMKTLLSVILWKLCGRLIGSHARKTATHAVINADAIIDIMGISFSDTLRKHSFWRHFEKGRFFLLGKILGKPVIKYTTALGPMQTKWNRMFARLYLGRCCDLILARDEESLQAVRSVGIRTDALVCPDTAFLFDAAVSPVSKRISSIGQRRPVVGISVSYQAQYRGESPKSYVKATAELIRYVSKRYSAHVVIIPNEVTKETRNDVIVANEIHMEVTEHDCEVLDVRELRAEQIKGVIQQCDAIVTARYHTLIAALSLGVPVLAVSWHHKYAHALGLFGQEEYLCDVKDCRADNLIRLFDYLWRNREQVRQTILSGLSEVQERIDAGARCVYTLLQTRTENKLTEACPEESTVL